MPRCDETPSREVRGGLAGRVGLCGAIGVSRRRRRSAQGAVDFVGRYLQEAAHTGRARASSRRRVPDDVGIQERSRRHDAAIDVALGGEVHDRVDAVLCISSSIAAPSRMSARDEQVPGVALEVAQVLEVTGVGQRVDVDDRSSAAAGAPAAHREPMKPAPPVTSRFMVLPRTYHLSLQVKEKTVEPAAGRCHCSRAGAAAATCARCRQQHHQPDTTRQEQPTKKTRPGGGGKTHQRAPFGGRGSSGTGAWQMSDKKYSVNFATANGNSLSRWRALVLHARSAASTFPASCRYRSPPITQMRCGRESPAIAAARKYQRLARAVRRDRSTWRVLP